MKNWLRKLFALANIPIPQRVPLALRNYQHEWDTAVAEGKCGRCKKPFTEHNFNGGGGMCRGAGVIRSSNRT
jgi:hypothetical protein